MRQLSVFLILSLGFAMFAGCSSLPKGPPPTTELNSRTSSFHKLGREHYRAGRLAKAEAYFRKALAVHADMDDQPGVALSFLSLGRVQLAGGDVGAATRSFTEAGRSAVGRPDLQVQVLTGQASIAQHLGQNVRARALLQEALTLPLAEGGRIRAVLYHDLGTVFRTLGDPTEAEKYLDASLQNHEARHDRQGIATACYSLALLSGDTGNLTCALAFARRALENDKVAQNVRGIAKDLVLLAKLHRENGDDDAAAGYQRRLELSGLGWH